jgi:hypothetical protein
VATNRFIPPVSKRERRNASMDATGTSWVTSMGASHFTAISSSLKPAFSGNASSSFIFA